MKFYLFLKKLDRLKHKLLIMQKIRKGL